MSGNGNIINSDVMNPLIQSAEEQEKADAAKKQRLADEAAAEEQKKADAEAEKQKLDKAAAAAAAAVTIKPPKPFRQAVAAAAKQKEEEEQKKLADEAAEKQRAAAATIASNSSSSNTANPLTTTNTVASSSSNTANPLTTTTANPPPPPPPPPPPSPSPSPSPSPNTVASSSSNGVAPIEERYAIIQIDTNGKITVLDSYDKDFDIDLPSRLLKTKTASTFAIKVTKIDINNKCIENDNTKCITYNNTTYKLDLSTAFIKDNIITQLIEEDFLGIVATTAVSNVPGTTASGTNLPVTTTSVTNGSVTTASVPTASVPTASVPTTSGTNGSVTTASVPTASVPTTSGTNGSVTTASVPTTSVTAATATNDDGCKELVQDISGMYYKESGNITQISDFYRYIPVYLFLNNIISENKNCSNETKTDIHTIMDTIYMMPTKFNTLISDNNLDRIIDIKYLYELMQFVSVTGDYEKLTAAAISKKLELLLLSVPTTATTSAASSLNMIAPSNASNSCWLNSILMAYLVPLYVKCGNDVDKLKKDITFLDGQLYIVDLIYKYIDAHFGKNDRTNYDSSEIIRDIKKYLVRPTVFGELNEYYHLITPDGTNNQHTFLSNNIFDFKSVLNKSQKITNITNGTSEEMNVVPLNINATTMSMSIDASNNNLLTIDNRTYQIDKDISFITFQSETEGEFSQTVQDFLNNEITVGAKVYHQVSFVLAGRGHFVVVVKNNDSTYTYSMIDDLPPTIKDISEVQVKSLISNRTQLLDGYYVTGIVYMLNDFVCSSNPFDDVIDDDKLKQEKTDVKADIKKDNAKFKEDIEKAIHIYSDTTTNNTNPSFNQNQVDALNRLLKREFPPATTSGGSRKNRGQKSKKTKRKYYVYKK